MSMSYKQKVLKTHPFAFLECVSSHVYDYGGVRGVLRHGRTLYYNIRTERPFGKVIGKGRTSQSAWKSASDKLINP